VVDAESQNEAVLGFLGKGRVMLLSKEEERPTCPKGTECRVVAPRGRKFGTSSLCKNADAPGTPDDWGTESSGCEDALVIPNPGAPPVWVKRDPFPAGRRMDPGSHLSREKRKRHGIKFHHL